MADQGRWNAGGDPTLNEINRADRFIEALSTKQPVYSTDPGEAELAYLFADWRDGVRESPSSVMLTEQDVLAALEAGRPRRANRLSLAVVGSAAAAVLCLGGFGAAVYAAGPGDALYGLHTMVFGGGNGQTTRTDPVALAAQQELAQVQQLVDQGQWQQAQDKLVALSDTVQNVEAVEQQHDLIQQWNALSYKVVEQDPAATLPPPGAPLPELPASPLTLLPVPELPATTQASDTSTSATDTTSVSTSASTSASTSPSTSPTDPTTTAPSETSGSATPTTNSPTTNSPTTTSPVEATSTGSSNAPTSTPTTSAPATTAAPSTTSAPTTAPSTSVAATTTVPPTTVPPTTAAPTTTLATVAPTTTAPAAAPSTTAPAQQTQQAPARTQQEAPVTTTTVVAPGGAR